MFVHYRTRGLIFKKENRGEANQLFTIYSKDFGKLEVLGRGIRKISSKLRSGAEVFYWSEIEFIQGKTYKTLTDALLIEKFENLKKDLKRLSVAYKILEVLDNLISGQEPDEKIWDLLITVFKKLNKKELKPKNLEIIYHYFFWNLISILGYKPELYDCPVCQKKLTPQNLYFNEKEGGVTCQNCFQKIKSGKVIKPEIVKILRVIIEKKWEMIFKLKIEDKYLKTLDVISRDYLNLISDKKI